MTSETTPVLGLQLTAAGQSMKHVTVNEALLRLDALVHLAVKERGRNAPPDSPVAGDRYLIGALATGAFAGHAGEIASYDAGVWTFLTPHAGWRAYIAAESVVLVFNGTIWTGFSAVGANAELQNVALLGIGTTADTTNRLAVKAANAIFSAVSAPTGTGDLRFKLNKDAASNTVSQLYQTGYSGRAETGLIGNDHFGVKVSAEGTTWKTALDIDGATGVVSAPQGILGAPSGFRNRIINGAFGVNQRVVSGTVTLAAGAYGHDRWKAGAAGCTYTFATTNGVTTLTITAGTLLQIIEGGTIAEGGVHTASWSGTAQARVYQGGATGSYVSSRFQTGALTAATNTTLEFSAGTVSKVQMEPGAIATVFEERPFSIELQLCQRFFEKSYDVTVAPGAVDSAGAETFFIIGSGISNVGITAKFKTPKRATPTITMYSPTTGTSGKMRDLVASSDVTAGIVYAGHSAFGWYAAAVSSGVINFTGQWVASSEL